MFVVGAISNHRCAIHLNACFAPAVCEIYPIAQIHKPIDFATIVFKKIFNLIIFVVIGRLGINRFSRFDDAAFHGK